jgi:hypothetical protein
VQLLLDHGADVNVQKADLWAPLHLASANGHLKVAELLIDRGAEVDVRNEDQKTPLHLASEMGNSRLRACGQVRLRCQFTGQQGLDSITLQRHGMDISVLWSCSLILARTLACEIAAKKPLDLAQENGKRDVTSFLARRSGNVCVLNTMSSTPLEAGSQNSLPEIAEPQLDNGDSSNKEESNRCIAHWRAGTLDVFRDYSIAVQMSTNGTKYSDSVGRSIEARETRNCEDTDQIWRGCELSRHLWLDPVAHGSKIWAHRRCAIVARQRR